MGSSNSTPSAPPSAPSKPPSAPLPNPELNEPWREFDWGKKKDLKEELENFSPSHPDVKHIKILVAGQIGAGKSSFINSVDSVFQGRISSRAIVNSAAGFDHSFTRNLKGFTIRSGKKKLPFIFKDIMGLEADVLKGSQTEDKGSEADVLKGSQVEDIIKVVFGHVKDDYKFKEDQPITPEDRHYISDPSLSEQSFCLVYVVDANTVQFTDDRLIDKLKIIRRRISDEGIPQVVVMTKVDEACPLIKNNLKKVYNSKRIKEKMELCSAKVGVPLTNIFPVKNYHDEINTNDYADVLILKALEQIVYLADDRLVDTDS